MPITDYKLLAYTKKVGDLADKPNVTMTAAEIKAQFDAAPEELRAKYNGLIDFIATNFEFTNLAEINEQLAETAKKTGGFVSPEMFGAVGGGIVDDSTAFRNAIAYAFNNHLTLRLNNTRYKLSGDNPFGLPYIASESSITFYQSEFTGDDNRATYRLNIDGNNAVIRWYPVNETDVFAFVGYLRHSKWKDFFVHVVPPSAGVYYGDIFSTYFGVPGQSHIFSLNEFSNIKVSGGCRRIFSFDCRGTEFESHDDLSLFTKISAEDYKVFCYVSNINSVSNTFQDCSTFLNVDNSIDFQIAGTSWGGGLRVNNHHFTIANCTGAVFFKADTTSTQMERKIFVSMPRVEVYNTAISWKYFDMNSFTLVFDGMESLSNPNYNAANIYGIIRNRFAKVIFNRNYGVFTPFAVYGTQTTIPTRACLEFIGCVFRNGNAITDVQEHPFITYCQPDGTPYANRYAALSSTYLFGRIIVKNSDTDYSNYLNGWHEDYVLYGSGSFPEVTTKKRLLFNKNGSRPLVDRTVTYRIPFDIIIEKLQYNPDAIAGIDQVVMNFPNAEMTNITKAITTLQTELVDATQELYLKAGTLFNFIFSKSGTINNEVLLGVNASHLLIQYRHPATLSEIQKSIICQLITKT